MMTQVNRNQPASPRAAARRRAPIDRLLDPELFKALSDPTRVRLWCCLVKCGRPCSVSEVAECCDVDFSVVARHLALLNRTGLVSSEKTGRTVWYRARGADLCARLKGMTESIEQWCDGDSGACRPAKPKRRGRT